VAGVTLGSTSTPITTTISATGNGRHAFQNNELNPITDTADADFDNNTAVDGKDFLIWQRGFGSTGTENINDQGDANGDFVVNCADLEIWKEQYGLGQEPTNPSQGYIRSFGVPGSINTITAPIHS